MGNLLTHFLGGNVEDSQESKKSEALRLIGESRKRYLNKIFNEYQSASGPNKHKEYKTRLRTVDIQQYDFPFENLVFRGGGFKCISFYGAVDVLKEYDIMKNIKRFAGASAGATFAVFMAMGVTLEDYIEAFGSGIIGIILDSRWGYLSLIPDAIRGYGLFPGLQLYKLSGEMIAKKTNGNPDLTFLEFYKLTGKEICIVATNLNQMEEEYFHVKTTPHMPIRLAVRMAVCVPGLLQPVEQTRYGLTGTYVDGGLVCNFPIHCFDGWYLSMKPFDAFLKRLQPSENVSQLMNRRHRLFSDPNNKRTLGIMLYTEFDNDILRHKLEIHKMEKVGYPDTELARKKKESVTAKERNAKENLLVQEALDDFFSVITKRTLNGSCKISKSELQRALQKNAFKSQSFKILFGEDTSIETVFEAIGEYKNELIDHQDLINFIESIGVSLKERLVGYNRKKINGIMSFFSSFQLILRENAIRQFFGGKDLARTVGINTGYIETYDSTLEEQDYQFLVKRGRQAMEVFLRNYVLENNLQKRTQTT